MKGFEVGCAIKLSNSMRNKSIKVNAKRFNQGRSFNFFPIKSYLYGYEPTI